MGPMLEGRVAVVTGGGRGVGRGVSRALAEAGAHVVIAQRGVEEGEAEAAHLREAYDVDCIFTRTDVTQRADVDALINAASSHFGRLDILVNNAGESVVKRLENHSDEDMQAHFDLNYFSAFWAMRAAFPIMKEQGYGRVINMGSLNGVNAHVFTAGYNASKEALRAMTRTAAAEWGGFGITCNVICPSAMSPLARQHFEANPHMADEILKCVPAGRFGDADKDIGPVAVFLASEGSAYYTGNTLFVDGGGHLNGVPWRPVAE